MESTSNTSPTSSPYIQYRSLRPTTPSPRDPTIRHAGRAHIRGKIRRVWRPRYLELCDTGLVRYYELPPTADVTLPEDSDWDHVNMIPKDTLVIYHARIIDQTTLRDLHVGLPKGSYGFLFRGQRQYPLELLLGPGSGVGDPNPPREYFCAVSTLEEAQTWVIVLQWAASVCKSASHHPRSSHHHHHHPQASLERSTSMSSSVGGGGGPKFWGDSCTIPSGRLSAHHHQADNSNRGTAYTTSASGPNKPATTTGQDEGFVDAGASVSGGSIGAATTTTTDSMGTPTHAVLVSKHPPRSLSSHRNHPHRSSAAVGRIVVTKVDGYQLIKVPASSPAASLMLLEWQVAYEIGILIIQGTRVEERCILRTSRDLTRLLDELSREVDSKISLNLIDEWKSKLQTRPLPPTLLQGYKENNKKNSGAGSAGPSTIVSQIAASFTIVDQLLRALAMDANLCNSHALKKWLVLTDSDGRHSSTLASAPPVSSPCWWKTQTPRELEQSLTYRYCQTVPEDDLDSFVKHWLASKKRPISKNDWKTTTFLWVLQHPWMVLGGAGVGLALSVPLARVYQHVMVSVSMRLDVLMGSWCLAAYLGKEYWNWSSGNGAQDRVGGKLLTPTSRLARSSPRPRIPTSRPQQQQQQQPLGLLSSRSGESFDVAASNDDGNNNKFQSTVVVTNPPPPTTPTLEDDMLDTSSVDSKDDLDYLEHHEEDEEASVLVSKLSSPLPQYPQNNGESCWSSPTDNSIFRVRGNNYLEDRVKIPSGPSPFVCRGVDVWLTDNPERHIARHPAVLNGKLGEEDTFLVNFLLPFGNFVSYFTVPPLSQFPDKLATVWSRFVKGDQQYRDKRLKLLPVVMDGPWIVRTAVGNGTAPALLGKVIPLQYYFQEPENSKAVYEVDVIITASSIAKGILSVVKGHTKSLTIAFAFIIEAAEQEELPETVLCAFQVHQLHLEDCPHLPECNLDEI